jgi:chromate transporter
VIRLRDVAAVFLRLGVTAFGGPAVHVAMMEEEVVRRRKWVAEQRFLDLFGAANLIPGPNSTELAIHIGHDVGGWPGLLVAGACFIVPAALITLALAIAYVRFGAVPAMQGLLWAVKPVVVAVVAQALFQLGKKALKTYALYGIALVAAVANFLGVHELIVLACAAAFALALDGKGTRALMPMPLAAPALIGPLPLFLVFAKIGSVLFGSGYVLLAFLRAELVERRHWMTEAQLLDAIAAGQVTPGPVFTTSTFVGYVIGRGPGALAATCGIFLPAFVFVAVTAPLVAKLRTSKSLGRVLDGVNAASLALMAVVAFRLARGALIDPLAIAIALISLVLLVRFKANSAWLVVGAGVLGVGRALFLR